MKCARCGTGIGNGGIDRCSILNDLDPREQGSVRALRYCRDREAPETGFVKGCTTMLHEAMQPPMEEN